MTDQFSILKLVTARLDAVGIAYMLTGSIAAGYYAQPRMTRDIDLVVELEPADAERIAGALTPEFNCDVDVIRGAIARQSLFNLIHVEAVAKVDFVIRKDIPYRREEFRRRRHVEIGEHPLWIVSPEDLILSKLASAPHLRAHPGPDVSGPLGREPHRHRSPTRGARLTDTPPDVQARFDELMRQRSGSDRVRMMSEMFDFARALVLSNLRTTHPGATDAELRVLLFDRLYGDELDPTEHGNVVARLRRERQPV